MLVMRGAGAERDDRSEAMAGGVMRANVGDLLVLPGSEAVAVWSSALSARMGRRLM
jgi:hypothetical protein